MNARFIFLNARFIFLNAPDSNDVSNYAISAGSEFAARTLEGWGQKKSVDVADALSGDDEEY